MSDSKRAQMLEFWSERAKLYGSDPRANTNDIWLREIEIRFVHAVIDEVKPKHVLDFGCANGFSTSRLAELAPGSTFVGIDINPTMIGTANTFITTGCNLDFRLLDIVTEPINDSFNLIYAVRVFQNLESAQKQHEVADKLISLLSSDGFLLYIESYVDGYAQLNSDRQGIGLPPLPVHPHLTLLTDSFDEHIGKQLRLVKRESLSSSYYLITRLLYSYIAGLNQEVIDYDHVIHRVAAMLPQIGDYGPQRANLYMKK